MKLEKILVPLDGSALAEAALPKAVDMAESSGAKVLLIRAAEAHTLPGVDPTEAQIKVVQEAEDYLAQVGDRLAALGLKNVETSVWYGPAAYAIVEAARLNKVDLIAMTTHGRSGLGRLILGSVAESVLRGTTTPILLIRAAEAPVKAPVEKGEAKPWKGSMAGRV
jgi:nucleotide-binding universal stress UspA family protein